MSVQATFWTLEQVQQEQFDLRWWQSQTKSVKVHVVIRGDVACFDQPISFGLAGMVSELPADAIRSYRPIFEWRDQQLQDDEPADKEDDDVA